MGAHRHVDLEFYYRRPQRAVVRRGMSPPPTDATGVPQERGGRTGKWGGGRTPCRRMRLSRKGGRLGTPREGRSLRSETCQFSSRRTAMWTSLSFSTAFLVLPIPL